ncbi:MAG: hypothetical protein R2705_07950 [Ilumatobacteraceae bacterium]
MSTATTSRATWSGSAPETPGVRARRRASEPWRTDRRRSREGVCGVEVLRRQHDVQAGQHGISGDEPGHGPHPAGQVGGAIAEAGQDRSAFPFLSLVDDVEQQPLLGAEVVQQPGVGHPDPFGELGDARTPEALGREQPDGFVDDLVTPILSARLSHPVVGPRLHRFHPGHA